jgi:hypothetical protein
VRYLTIQHGRCRTEPMERLVDRLMEELLKIEAGDPAITDSDLAVDLSECIVEVQMIVDAPDQAQAMVKALAALRSAIHAVGVSTPGWKTAEAKVYVAPATADDDLLTRVLT